MRNHIVATVLSSAVLLAAPASAQLPLAFTVDRPAETRAMLTLDLALGVKRPEPRFGFALQQSLPFEGPAPRFARVAAFDFAPRVGEWRLNGVPVLRADGDDAENGEDDGGGDGATAAIVLGGVVLLGGLVALTLDSQEDAIEQVVEGVIP